MGAGNQGVVIVGASKTGTTGLYASIRAGYEEAGRPSYGLFEKYDVDLLRNLARLAPSTPLVLKVLLSSEAFDDELVERFERRVLIVRDPRDTMVSAALYAGVKAVNAGADSTAIDEYVAMVQAKERDPSSCSFRSLMEHVYVLAKRPPGRYGNERFAFTTRYAAAFPSHVLRYEDFIRDRLDDVSDYLGIPVRNTKPTGFVGNVVRSASDGEWRMWFTQEDIDYYRPIMAEYMETFGYPDDWDLPAEQRIDPATGSHYLQQAAQNRRHDLELGERRGDISSERIEQLRDRADRGAARSAFHLAQALRKSDADTHATEIFERALFAASCGHVRAMRLLSNCYRKGLGVTADLQAAARWREEADAAEEPAEAAS